MDYLKYKLSQAVEGSSEEDTLSLIQSLLLQKAKRLTLLPSLVLIKIFRIFDSTTKRTPQLYCWIFVILSSG